MKSLDGLIDTYKDYPKKGMISKMFWNYSRTNDIQRTYFKVSSSKIIENARA